MKNLKGERNVKREKDVEDEIDVQYQSSSDIIMAIIVENKDVASGNKEEVENDDEKDTDTCKSVECYYEEMVKKASLKLKRPRKNNDGGKAVKISKKF